MKSKFLSRFLRAAPNRKGVLIGDRILVEVIEEDLRKTKGGIIIAESEHARAEFVMLKTKVGVVLEVGEGYYNAETNEHVPLTVKPGNVVWISENGIRFCTTLPTITEGLPKNALALGTEAEVHKYWHSIEDYLADQQGMEQ